MSSESVSPKRIAALLAVALMVVAPALWVAWSLTAASSIASDNRDQADTLASLQARLATLTGGSTGNQKNVASVYLPGKSQAIAGAALQRIVANTVQGIGGHVVQSEVTRPDATGEEPGTVSLRAEFETDIVGLQRVVFALETGAPILMIKTLTVETGDRTAADSANPALRIVLTVRGYLEA